MRCLSCRQSFQRARIAALGATSAPTGNGVSSSCSVRGTSCEAKIVPSGHALRCIPKLRTDRRSTVLASKIFGIEIVQHHVQIFSNISKHLNATAFPVVPSSAEASHPSDATGRRARPPRRRAGSRGPGPVTRCPRRARPKIRPAGTECFDIRNADDLRLLVPEVPSHLVTTLATLP